jgi:hypothetical protein
VCRPGDRPASVDRFDTGSLKRIYIELRHYLYVKITLAGPDRHARQFHE